MKKALLLSFILFLCSFVYAQDREAVQTDSKGSYLTHTVVAKETYFSIGRHYHVTPNDIAAFNGLDMKTGLKVGQQIKVPVAKPPQAEAAGKPIYYVVEPHEGLYRVSVKHHNVPLESLRKWNNLANDNISVGQKLIVGYTSSGDAAAVAKVTPEPVKKPVTEEPKRVEEERKTIEKNETAEVKPAGPKVEEKVNVAKKEEERRPEPAAKQAVYNVSANDGNGGYFKPLFEKQIKVQPLSADQTVSAGIFKTSSGWQDAKYYALMDHVEPGTIIKIINPSNNKAVYAKVLGEMSGIRQNQGYELRISNAAATALDVTDTDKFIVRVNY